MNGGRNSLRVTAAVHIYEHHYETKDYSLLKTKSSPWLHFPTQIIRGCSHIYENVGVDKHPHTLQQECRVVHNQTTFQSHSRLPRLIYSLRRIFPVRFQDFFHLTFFLRRFHCFFSIFFHSYFPSMVTTMAKIQKI